MFGLFSRFLGDPRSSQKQQMKSVRLHWIVRGEFAVGPLPESLERQELLIKEGICSILTLCREDEGTPPKSLLSKVSWKRVVLDDSHSELAMDAENLARAIDQAEEYIQSSAPLYIHCVAGMERSPSVCVGYLCKYKGLKLWEALNWVKQANPKTNILDSQLRAIQIAIEEQF